MPPCSKKNRDGSPCKGIAVRLTGICSFHGGRKPDTSKGFGSHGYQGRDKTFVSADSQVRGYGVIRNSF